MKYADVIVDISLRKLDRTYQYRIPPELEEAVQPGVRVQVSFGTRVTGAYVLEVTDTPEIAEDLIKDIIEVSDRSVPIDSELIRLAAFLKETYGGTMNQALKTVLPSKKKVRAAKTRVEQTPVPEMTDERVILNAGQKAAVEGILASYPKPALLYGVTGSGKTEVYMELIEAMRARGKQSILLIPEISLTYQNVRRFYSRFGDRVGVVNSRLSAGEKYEVFRKAEQGEIDLMLGPRSALFTPFPDLGLIIVDEEHETAYNSETTPCYKAVEVALERGRIAGAGVVLGSATPLVEDYTKALSGEYGLYRLDKRAKEGSALPEVRIVDLREELRQGNKTIFSRVLAEGIKDRLEKHEQVMLFLNRRGYAGFVSCRSCGHVIKCPHCDVSLTMHRGNKLMCHYCGYTAPMPEKCPSCGSPYLAGFGLGTQKVESMVHRYFPEAKTLRMDTDTTAGKAGHSRILAQFAEHKADILIGTQMIVKGHDFPDVTLMGIMAADMSLYSEDFRSAERTFQLLTQAAGRAGRADAAGLVVIQTYSPENATIQAAAGQDYEAFYKDEIGYRRLLRYPPCGAMMSFLLTGPDEVQTEAEARRICRLIERDYGSRGIEIIGPSASGIRKVEDKYRMIFYVKHSERALLREIRDYTEQYCAVNTQIDML